MMSYGMLNNDPSPRLCCLKKWEDFNGYGFKLSGEEGVLGPYDVCGVKSGSPAACVGLKDGDRVVEVNGHSVEGDTLEHVVDRIQENNGSVNLLVLDAMEYLHYTERHLAIRGDMSNIIIITCPDTSDGESIVSERGILETNTSDSPGTKQVRQCCLKKWDDFDGYGFNIRFRGTADEINHQITDIESDSPARKAGLKDGDIIVEVNGHNIEEESHQEVVEKMKNNPKSIRLLVLDDAAVAYYKERNITVRGDMSDVLTIICPETSDGKATRRFDAPQLRQCVLKKWEDFKGYGFNLTTTKGEVCQIVHAVDIHSPAERVGLQDGDRLVEVNGHNIDSECHEQVVERIQKDSNYVCLLVLDATAVAYYHKDHKLRARGDMPNVITIICPDTSDGKATTRSGPAEKARMMCNLDGEGIGVLDVHVGDMVTILEEITEGCLLGLVNGHIWCLQADSLHIIDATNEDESSLDQPSTSETVIAAERGKDSKLVELLGKKKEERNPPNITPRGVCQYKMMCTEFKKSLNISGDYFDVKYDICYCVTCHSKRGDKPFYVRGDPPKIYAIPVGWCRFALRMEVRAKDLEVDQIWHRAYHGTHTGSVASIFRAGNIFAAGTDVLDCSELKERPGHYNDNSKPGGFDTKRVFLSPSIVYSGCDVYAKSTSFVSPSTDVRYSAKTVLQVCIKPGSYEVSGNTISAKNIDPLFDDAELEWSTKTHGAIIVYGLLIKLTALT